MLGQNMDRYIENYFTIKENPLNERNLSQEGFRPFK